MNDRIGRRLYVGDTVEVTISGPGPGVPGINDAKVQGRVAHEMPHSIIVQPDLDTDELADLYARLGVDDPVELAELGEVEYSGEPTYCKLIERGAEYITFERSLTKFKEAAQQLLGAWDNMPGDCVVDYPDGWLSFEEEYVKIWAMDMVL